MVPTRTVPVYLLPLVRESCGHFAPRLRLSFRQCFRPWLRSDRTSRKVVSPLDLSLERLPCSSQHRTRSKAVSKPRKCLKNQIFSGSSTYAGVKLNVDPRIKLNFSPTFRCVLKQQKPRVISAQLENYVYIVRSPPLRAAVLIKSTKALSRCFFVFMWCFWIQTTYNRFLSCRSCLSASASMICSSSSTRW